MVAMCQGLSLSELNPIEKIAIESQVPKGTRLFDEGQVGDGLYLVLTGSIEVTKQGQVLATVESGAAVGEMSLVADGEKRSASAVALTGLTLIKLPASGFRALLAQNDPGALKVVLNLARVMSKRLAAINDKLIGSHSQKKEELVDFGKILNAWNF